MDEFDRDLEFEWDKGNVDKNWKKHKVVNKESEEIFFDARAMRRSDIRHSKKEERWLLLGKTKVNKKLAVVFTKRKSKIRIISARPMNKKEKLAYEKQKISTNT